MRGDLDFLYQKAMRSQDIEFIDEVAVLLGLENRFDDADNLVQRAENMYSVQYGHNHNNYDKFSFIVSDSQMGENWYRNK